MSARTHEHAERGKNNFGKGFKFSSQRSNDNSNHSAIKPDFYTLNLSIKIMTMGPSDRKLL